MLLVVGSGFNAEIFENPIWKQQKKKIKVPKKSKKQDKAPKLIQLNLQLNFHHYHWISCTWNVLVKVIDSISSFMFVLLSLNLFHVFLMMNISRNRVRWTPNGNVLIDIHPKEQRGKVKIQIDRKWRRKRETKKKKTRYHVRR